MVQTNGCGADVPPMDAVDVLDRLRGVVVVVDALGTVTAGYGGFGGILGYDVADLVGECVFDFVAPGDVDDLAIYFLENAGQALDVVSLPLPFRVHLIGADGLVHPVDVVPTGVDDDGSGLSWVVLLVPVALQTAVSRSLELEMAGAPRSEVHEMLTEELVVDNDQYSTRWFLVSLDGDAPASVVSARADCAAMVELIGAEVRDRGWGPWSHLSPGGAAMVPVRDLPDPLREHAESKRWRRVTVAPVHLDGSVVAAYVLFGRVPDGYDVGVLNLNVVGRIRNLVNVTALLIGRWRERDRLVTAATRDSLTGLANRDALFDACAAIGESAAVLYIDVDRFKGINDAFGHDVGDRVLQEVAGRIVLAAGSDAVVARFGGDEFVVLVDADDPGEAERTGRRILDAFEAPMSVGDFRGRVGVSIGMSPIGHRPCDGAVSAADRAMLEAKRSGRHRLVTASPPVDA